MNAWNSLRHLLRRHADAGVARRANSIQLAAAVAAGARERDVAALGELAGVAQQLSRIWRSLASASACMAPTSGRALARRAGCRSFRQRPDRGRPTSSTSVAIVERLEIELHLAGLDLRQVEDVVDQREQMPCRRRWIFAEVGHRRLSCADVVRVLAAASRCSR